MYKVTHYSKDGSGFMGGSDPFILDGFMSEEDAAIEANRLNQEGYKTVNIVSASLQTALANYVHGLEQRLEESN